MTKMSYNMLFGGLVFPKFDDLGSSSYHVDISNLVVDSSYTFERQIRKVRKWNSSFDYERISKSLFVCEVDEFETESSTTISYQQTFDKALRSLVD